MGFRQTVLSFSVLLSLLWMACVGCAQDQRPVRWGSCAVNSLTIRIDTLSIEPHSFHLMTPPLARYRLDPVTATLHFLDSAMLGRIITYNYRVLAFDYSRPVFHKSISLMESPIPVYQPMPNTLSTVADMQEESAFLASGSVSRGVSVGNAQDLVLNASLNLQLSGKLSDNISVEAVISDKNVPIQPEGNTQTIYDINNIFITILFKDIARIDAGNIDVHSPEDYFMKLSRSSLGMQLRLKSVGRECFQMTNTVGGGAARGKFVQQKITPQNGVQGPYKLYGEDGAAGIVVIAASERVYVDGRLLVRGQQNDYVMDYNTAELTFTPAMLVTSEKRIVVEFEYTDRHYARYNLFSYNDLSFGNRVKLHVNFYQEQDLKHQSIQPELDDDQKRFLSQMGDNIEDCYYDFVDTASFSDNRVLYCRKDTVADGVLYRDVYAYCTRDSVQLYALGFTYMGANKGSYRLLSSTVNGRVFGWVAPENGELRGEYEPVLLLTSPKLLQMATISADFDLSAHSQARAELAISNYDQNTFSKKDAGDNVGFACFLDLRQARPIQRKMQELEKWRWNSALQWQFVHKNFHAVDRFREVEFVRNYNLSESTSACSEQMLQASASVLNPEVSQTTYSLNWLSQLGNTLAVRNVLKSENQLGRFLVRTETSHLFNRDSLWRSSFWSSNSAAGVKFRHFEVGVTDLLEHNVFRSRHTDSLRGDSYAFNEVVAYVKSGDTALCRFNLQYKNRVNLSAQSEDILPQLVVHEATAGMQIDRIRNQHFGMNVIYRNQRMIDSMRALGKEHYYVGKVEYSGRFCKNAISLNAFYEAGSGMEQRRIFTYVRVADGQGTYMWHDYNENGIEEMDEFDVAAFQDEANYVKVWITGNEYFNTYNNQCSMSLQLRPDAVWHHARGLRGFLARFQDVAMVRTQLQHLLPQFNPFYRNTADTNLTGKSVSYNNTLSFNNSASVFAFDYVVQGSQNKSLLYYGFEQNRVSSQQVVLKSAPVKQLLLQTSYLYKQTTNQSDFLANRCYDIVTHQGEAMLQVNFKNIWSGSATYTFAHKSNVISVEQLSQHKMSANFSLRMIKRGTMSCTVQYVHIRGTLAQDTPLSYVMLEGLNLGGNAVWNVGFQLAVTDFLQLSLQYDGRASKGHKVVHSGNLTVRARF